MPNCTLIKNPFMGNEGIKRTFTILRYKKLMQYLHVLDRATELPRNDPNYDRLAKIWPIIQMAEKTFKDRYLPGQNQTIDEAMVAFKGRLSYMQYMPAKPIKCGIKVWLRCDADTAYMHQFSIYLGCGQNSPEGLGYDVVMQLCEQIRGKNHHVYFDNLFTSVPLLNDLLEHKIYACGTVRKNKKKLPLSVKNPGKMQRGAHKTFQLGNTNLVATVWKDNREVRVLSTNSRPDMIVAANCQIGQQQVQVNQPENVAKYKYMSGVDRHDQMRMHYDFGRFAKKSWKYLMWFFVNAALVNAFILWRQKSMWPTSKWRFTHLDFRKEVACGLIGEFSSRKRRCGPQPYLVRAVEASHENVHMESGRLGKRCKWHLVQKKGRKMTAFGCKLCGVHLCREGCHYAYHNQ